MGERKLSEKESGERRMIILTFCFEFSVTSSEIFRFTKLEPSSSSDCVWCKNTNCFLNFVGNVDYTNREIHPRSLKSRNTYEKDVDIDLIIQTTDSRRIHKSYLLQRLPIFFLLRRLVLCCLSNSEIIHVTASLSCPVPCRLFFTESCFSCVKGELSYKIVGAETWTPRRT